MVDVGVSSLDDLANKYNTDKGTKYPHGSRHGYAPIYDEYLTPIRNNNIRMLEVGVCMEYTEGGHSIYMWNEYFKAGNIYTFDIVDMDNHPAILNNQNVHFYRGNQEVRKDFIDMYNAFGAQEFDFILEDGSHEHHHQLISLGHLFKYVKSGGFYILEDMSIPDQPVCCIRNDETYKIINNFKDTGNISSPHLYDDEIDYLQKNVKSIEIYKDIQNAYAVAIITKK
jgi:cephalosporin hydroxylase